MSERPTTTRIDFTPAQMGRLSACGWLPGEANMAEWLTTRAEVATPDGSESHSIHRLRAEVRHWRSIVEEVAVALSTPGEEDTVRRHLDSIKPGDLGSHAAEVWDEAGRSERLARRLDIARREVLETRADRAMLRADLDAMREADARDRETMLALVEERDMLLARLQRAAEALEDAGLIPPVDDEVAF